MWPMFGIINVAFYDGDILMLYACYGMQLGRQRLFYNEGHHLKIWHSILISSTIIVIALSFVDFGELESWLKPIYNLIILLMIVSAISLPGMPSRAFAACSTISASSVV